MFGFGGLSEIAFILFLAMLIFGPQKLPEIARMLAKGMAEVRKASNELKRTLNAEIAASEQEAEARRQAAVTASLEPPAPAVASPAWPSSTSSETSFEASPEPSPPPVHRSFGDGAATSASAADPEVIGGATAAGGTAAAGGGTEAFPPAFPPVPHGVARGGLDGLDAGTAAGGAAAGAAGGGLVAEGPLSPYGEGTADSDALTGATDSEPRAGAIDVDVN